MELFIDRIQDIHPLLPLRLIPLKIKEFEETKRRMNKLYMEAFMEQYKAYDIWTTIMGERYTKEELAIPYEEVKI